MRKLLCILVSHLFSFLLYAQEWQGATPGDIYYNQGNVGVGTASPQSPLHVNGRFLITHPTFTGSLEIRQVANNQILFSSGSIGSFLRVGAGNIVDFDGQLLQSLGRGALLSGTVSGKALETVAGQVLLNTTSGNTLIGNSTDNGNKLQVYGNIWSTGLIFPTNAGAGKVLTSDANGAASWQTPAAAGWSYNGDQVGTLKEFGTTDNYALPFITNNVERMRIGANGNVGIGTTNVEDVNYKLFVETGIRTRKVKVDQVTWADYVFDPSYPLPGLEEVEAYIKEYRHLPEIPSASEVAENGVDLGEIQAVLLKKIEELVLYVIDIKKENMKMKEEIEHLKKSMDIGIRGK